jgi:hypothetical protein
LVVEVLHHISWGAAALIPAILRMAGKETGPDGDAEDQGFFGGTQLA